MKISIADMLEAVASQLSVPIDLKRLSYDELEALYNALVRARIAALRKSK